MSERRPTLRPAATHFLLAALVTWSGTSGASDAAQAPFQDNMAERTRACSACHGKQGRAAPDGFYPRIAGKPAGYLYHQLLNFREGRRHYGLMQHMVDPLTDAYLLEIARYFAALDLPYPAAAAVPPGTSPAQLQRGEALALRGDPAIEVPACVRCHGDALTGVQPGVPGLLGLPLDYLNAQLGAWRTGERHAHAPDCMAGIAKRLRPEDISALASWLSSRELPADTHPVDPNSAAAPARPMPLECGSATVRQAALR